MSININTMHEHWVQNLLDENNCNDIHSIPLEVIKEEIENTQADIDNQELWEMGSPTLEVSDMHRENIVNLQYYMVFLQAIKNKKEMVNLIVNENNPEGKDIRFIDSRYNELFKIPDNSYIMITLDTGEQSIRKCVFIDDTHVQIGGYNTFHICEFAEKMERVGSKYEPCSTPEKVAGYMITDRVPVGNKEVVLAYNPKAVAPYVTWVRHKDFPDYELGHYWSDKSKARIDLTLRADAERTGRSYDHTKLLNKDRDTGAR